MYIKKANKIISECKYAISNPENLYSFFVQDCLSNNLIVFYNTFLALFMGKSNKKFFYSVK